MENKTWLLVDLDAIEGCPETKELINWLSQHLSLEHFYQIDSYLTRDSEETPRGFTDQQRWIQFTALNWGCPSLDAIIIRAGSYEAPFTSFFVTFWQYEKVLATFHGYSRLSENGELVGIAVITRCAVRDLIGPRATHYSIEPNSMNLNDLFNVTEETTMM